MTFSFTHVFFLLGLIGGGLYFLAALRVREIALQAARRHCKAMDVQLLDQSVGIHRIWLKRDAAKKIRFWRSYQFEFASTGDERYRGRVVTLGHIVESVQLDPHRMNLH